MAKRHIHTYTDGENQAKIHKDTEWNEYRVSLHKNGFHMGDDHDYHTDDLDDAHGTAKLGLKSIKSHEDEDIEESTELSELSKGLLGRYIKKASFAANRDNYFAGQSQVQANYDQKHNAQHRADHTNLKVKAIKRAKGIAKAVDKITKEETELNELSKDLLRRYVKKGDNNYDHLVNRSYKDWKHAGEIPHTHPYSKLAVKKAKQSTHKADTRAKYLNKADDRLKEDLQELSNELMSRYIIKANAKKRPEKEIRKAFWKWIAVKEDNLDELSQERTIAYLNRACKERGDAERCGDAHKMTKRERGAYRAIDSLAKKVGPSKKRPSHMRKVTRYAAGKTFQE
jgi:hypothetical protein